MKTFDGDDILSIFIESNCLVESYMMIKYGSLLMYLFDIRKDRVIPLYKIKCTYSELRWYRGIIRPY